MKKAILFGEDNTDTESFDNLPNEEVNEFIQNLQQTEWDVEIVIDNILTFEANQIDARVNPNFGNPLLDADGCLILKRK
jgi:hypothetical protein